MEWIPNNRYLQTGFVQVILLVVFHNLEKMKHTTLSMFFQDSQLG